MFTGIVQGTASVIDIVDRGDIRSFTLDFPRGFCEELAVGSSVSVDGVCLTVTEIENDTRARFDVIYQSLRVTTLGLYSEHGRVNVERAAKDGAEIGGHAMSGHIDFRAEIDSVTTSQANKVLRIRIPDEFRRYVFAKGYIGINGCSLTVSDVDRGEGWIEMWLIPETRRVTVLDAKQPGDHVNVELERNTQVVVDTVHEAVEQSLGELKPLLEQVLREKGMVLEDLVQPKPHLTDMRRDG